MGSEWSRQTCQLHMYRLVPYMAIMLKMKLLLSEIESCAPHDMFNTKNSYSRSGRSGHCPVGQLLMVWIKMLKNCAISSQSVICCETSLRCFKRQLKDIPILPSQQLCALEHF